MKNVSESQFRRVHFETRLVNLLSLVAEKSNNVFSLALHKDHNWYVSPTVGRRVEDPP